jgi:predicted RNA-binding Zn ribbon-like protein
MGERQEAPGALERVREFVNTLDLEEERETLTTPAALRTWLADAGLLEAAARSTAADLRRAIALREALRAVLLSHNGAPAPPAEIAVTLDSVARRARIGLHFDERGASTLQPAAAGVDGALGRLLAIVHAAEADGTWLRLKACRDDGCAWAFYDQTRNHSRAWCDMQVCGNRAKVRAYRERHR